ncbi:putative luciferase-like monooxygenase [Actinoplanes missouriensis 431]|uniref:Putative luciferase-like monooxygenase n=1 Tax=Actinoplanes missouriensis (strain ATCC 14538 / DSM 43046 / CBS 188.64 / JCM 3121 / NBRC 102363 / NCIMB 12654 / NRRL B-3342 / UNCC 431) TaxID=512565 RepID=I0H5Z2_ACTM4|nr:LLM class F420-dependent oxidoreductase [Actinoplanes missouriensis]BAL88429.1 putative luciferase-like monooxygenase [Actinoplanes missouriensis 431]
MELRIFTEPQEGARHEDLSRVARFAEEAGFPAFFRSDHYLNTGSGAGLPGPSDAWITLAALARETTRIRLGVLMSAATFRAPGPLAVIAAQVDEMSGGRLEFGLGAGWFETEHDATGLRFPPLGERFDRLTEQLEIITGLWDTPDGERFDYQGAHYRITDSPALPKPVQRPRPPLIIGGKGPHRTPRLAARFAGEFNVSLRDIPTCRAQFDRVDAACERIGRDPAEIVRSVAQTVCVGADDIELQRRAKVLNRDVDDLRANGIAGTPAEVVDRIGRWREEAGVTRIYLQLLDLTDLAHLDLIAAEVMRQLD